MPWYKAERPGKKPKFVFCKSCDGAARRVLANDCKASVWNTNRYHHQGETYASTNYVLRDLPSRRVRITMVKSTCLNALIVPVKAIV